MITQPYYCSACGAGSVNHACNAGVSEVCTIIKADHRQRSPECKGKLSARISEQQQTEEEEEVGEVANILDKAEHGLAVATIRQKFGEAVEKYAQTLAEHVGKTLGKASLTVRVEISAKDNEKSGQLEFYVKPADVRVGLSESADKMGARISTDSGTTQLSLFDLD